MFATNRHRAFVSHGIQDETLGIHCGRQSRALLSELGVPLAYHEDEAGHAPDAAMVRDFNDWLVAHIDADRRMTGETP
jgi:phospholipase/carboxylesterase